MLTLRIVDGKDAGREISFPSLPMVMGRDNTCDLVLADRSVSRRHALILGTTDAPFIRDLGSANGTYLNRQRVTREVALEAGDRIQIGTTVLEVGGATTTTRRPQVDVLEDFAELATSVVQARVDAERTNLKELTMSQLEAPTLKARLDSLYRVTELIARSGSQSLRSILDGILDIAFDALPADHGAILLMRPGSQELAPEVARTRGEAVSEPVAISRTILKRCLDERVAILSMDVQSDARFGRDTSGNLRLMRSAICVPLIRGERVLGVLHVDTRETGARLAQADLELLNGIGNEAALAIENSRLAQEMVARERLATVGRTMAEFSHHVKNVLQGLAVYSPLIDDALADDGGPEHEMLSTSWRRVKGYHERLERTVLDVLSFAGERTPVLEPCDPRTLIARARESLEDRAAMAHVQVALAAVDPSTPFACRLDPGWIVSVLVNLGLNAIEAMEPQGGGTLTFGVGVDAAQGLLRFEVRDTGPGIPPQARGHIFECFFSTKGLKGTGLGLPIAKRFVEAHGGIVDFETEEGVGTRFVVSLPLDLGSGDEARPQGGPGTEREPAASPRRRTTQSGLPQP